MKTKRSLAPTIRARCYSSLLVILAIAWATLPGYGQTERDASLLRLAASYQKSPNAKDRAALLHFAAANNRTEHGALARLVIARGDIAQGRTDEALKLLENASPHLAALSDYILYLRAQAYAKAGNARAAGDAHQELLDRYAGSPLRTDAAIGAAKARLESSQPDDAIRALKTSQVKERQPEFGFLLGKAYLARNDHALAAAHLQQVYTQYPARSEARDAQILLSQIRQRLGEAYPPATAKDLMQRADALRKARQYAAARSALEAVLPDLAGEDRELAQVTIAAIDYDRLQTSAAQSALSGMKPQSGEANAQRLYYLVQSARRLKQPDAMLRHAAELRKRYPDSVWTMEAHRWAGNYFLLDNETETYLPLFEACAEAQPRNAESAYCHWKVAWHAYLHRDSKAHPLLASHLERYPYSDKYVAALLFLGRLAERDQRLAAARTYYEEVITVEPLSYYAELARESLSGNLLQGISGDQELGQILSGFRGRPLRENFRDLRPQPETQRALERASLLARIECGDWVEQELRTASVDADQRHLLAMELASSYASRGDHFRAMRTMKSMTPGYFRLQTDFAPVKFWHLLFPMPYAESLRKHSLERDLDPHLVAGLIRQESEFKPDAVSRAKAYGLMQVLPSTGRSLARTLGLGPFSVGMLTRPDVNLNMGTYYLSRLGNGFDGRLEYALASYNAGKSRADRWKTWGDFREPIEFIETIPFTETREYVLSVFRNAMVYRAVYPELSQATPRLRTASATATSAPAAAAPKPTPAKAPAKPTTAKAPAAKSSAAKPKPATAKKPAATKAKPATQARKP